MGGQIDMIFYVGQRQRPRKEWAIAGIGGDDQGAPPAYPGVPTVAESGEPGYFVDSWYGVFVPEGTPKEVIDQLNKAIKKASNEPDFKRALELEGLVAAVGTPAGLGEYVKQEESRWTKIIKDAGITDNP